MKKIRVLALHGLPLGPLDTPSVQLQAVYQELAPFSISWSEWHWAFGDETDEAIRTRLYTELLTQLIRGKFRSERVTNWAEWLKMQVATPDEDVSFIVIIAYSAGASIIYSWLVDKAKESPEVAKFARIFCIAGLYCFRSPGLEPGWIFLPQRRKPFKVGESSLAPEQICKAVLPEQLVVLLGSEDTTASPEFNHFSMPNCSNVEYRVIDGADHLSILTHKACTGKIVEDISHLIATLG
jgi:hypothetical protein